MPFEATGVAVPRFRFFVFTCRDPRTDFRLPLVDALRRHYETYYIWLRRRPVVSGPGINDAPVEMSIRALLMFMRRFRGNDKVNIYFNSTNTYFPGMSLLLRQVARAGVWCLDMHDDLRYHNKGFKRWQEGRIVSMLCRLSDVVVHAAPMLQELFPNSRHLGNASNLAPLPITSRNDGVLIVASFDERFDFDFLSDLATYCPTIQFHMHGWTRPDDSTTMARVKAVAARHDNIRYHGAYDMSELPGILGNYRISVAPYRVNTPITRYIDPLRFYHCLNAGLEVISTDIPQARYLDDWIHVVPNVADCARALIEIQAGRSAKQPGYSPITWEQKADRLVEILRSEPRIIALQGSRASALLPGNEADQRSLSARCRNFE
jgi:hypothetical protein